MKTLLFTLALASLLSGCVVVPAERERHYQGHRHHHHHGHDRDWRRYR